MTSARQLPWPIRIALLSGLDVWHTQPLPDAGVRSVMLSDGPHGLRKQEVGGDHLGTTGSKAGDVFPARRHAGQFVGPGPCCMRSERPSGRQPPKA